MAERDDCDCCGRDDLPVVIGACCSGTRYCEPCLYYQLNPYEPDTEEHRERHDQGVL